MVSPIYWFIRKFILVLHALNVVEWWKHGFRWVYRRLHPTSDPARSRTWDAVATDTFIAAKWLLLSWLLVRQDFSKHWLWINAYLLFMNLFTYFYYHAWIMGSISQFLDWDRVRRRLANAVLAMAYSILGFAYFYAGPLRTAMGLEKIAEYRAEAIILSITNALTVGCGPFSPGTTLARAVCSAQLINSFLFGTIILAASISSLFGQTVNSTNP